MVCLETLTSLIAVHKLSNCTYNRVIHNLIQVSSLTYEWPRHISQVLDKRLEKSNASNIGSHNHNAWQNKTYRKNAMVDTTNIRNVLQKFCTVNADENKDISKIEKMIKEHTCITRDSMTPEIALHLITPSCSLWTLPLEHSPFKDPFWAFYWPGGKALARYILDNPDFVRGQDVLDIGSGCGATAIAAAMSNACSVTANDIDSVAACAISLNCTLNNVKIAVRTDNIIGKCGSFGDIILVGDMFYDSEFASVLIKWLQMLRTQGKQILIGDPGRHAFKMYKDYFQQLIEYPLSQDDNSPGFSHVSIWGMK